MGSMGSVWGWLFAWGVAELFAWGVRMGLAGIRAPHGAGGHAPSPEAPDAALAAPDWERMEARRDLYRVA